MKKAYAVIGANFGDEGKGLMTDFFCRTKGSTITVRSNGGAQAGHTVCTTDGKRHVFSHVGSGIFAYADTYLSEYFIVNPMLFNKELNIMYDENISVVDPDGMLNAVWGIRKIYIDPRCMVTLPCDMLINQFLEKERGKSRHGSCGVGVYETILRSKDKRYALRYEDMTKADREDLKQMIEKINREYVPVRAFEAGITGGAKELLMDFLKNENLTDNFLSDFKYMAKTCYTSNEQIIENYDNVVFEAAQGLMLDQDREDYFPNLTPSSTGMKNIRSILDRLEKRDTEICYVTRSFFTRHGAGRFDTESKDIKKVFGLYDKTNAANEYQGHFRYGFFDVSEFMASLALDKRYHAKGDRVSIAVTHLDMSRDMMICPNGMISPEVIAYMADADKLYKSRGETANDISCYRLLKKKAR